MKSTLLFFLFLPFLLSAQQSQSISGTVKDKVTQQPIIGATVIIANSDPQIGTVTDLDGKFNFPDIKPGRYSVICTYIGFEDYQSEGIIVSSTKSAFLEIEINEGGVNLDIVEVKASGNVNKPVNDLAVVSTRSFSADESDRIAASVNDPGRLALAYPGVAQGSDDTENDIIIRGNSSFGMMWRLEGIDIPNPNHFARPGTSGGGITIFSSQLLSRSDFSTGGMPAEYGNAISGAMDVHFRKGNKQQKEHRFKFGVLGIDLATEGPIKQGKSSYLANYRYSTLGILTNLGVYLVGERVTNDFQDLSFNIALDGDEKNHFTVFGMGGLSEEHYNPVDVHADRDPTRAAHFEDRIRIGNMGTVGMTYSRFIDKKSYLKVGIAGIGSEIDWKYDVLDSLNNRSQYHNEVHNETRLSSSIIYSRKMNPTLRFKTGAFIHNILNYNFFKKTSQRANISDVLTENTDRSINGQGSTNTFQYFAQFSKDLSPRLTANVGAHFMLLGLNNTTSVEPRASLQYKLGKGQTVSFAYGLYSKMLPMAGYFYTQNDTINGQITESLPNLNLPFIKSHHYILSYNYATEKGLRFSAEAYYQSLFNVPVSPDSEDLYWMLNTRSTFPETAVESSGTGQNYGVDLAIEKFFSNKLFFLLTGSYFKSYFSPKNGERYATTFANDFVSALTIGREFAMKKGRTLQVGGRILYNGGNRYTPLDAIASAEAGIYIGDPLLTNTAQLPNYFRIDTRIAYRYNAPKLAGSISLDIQNITARNNPNGVSYDAEGNELVFRTHSSGLVPVLAFGFDF